MKNFFPALLALSSALFPAMGEQSVSPSTATPSIVFKQPELATPLTEAQQEQAGLLLCRIHDRASADAAAAPFAMLLSSAEGKISHWLQFGNTRFWRRVLPTIAAADYYGSESLKSLFTPLTTPAAEVQETAAPYTEFMQDFMEACAGVSAALENAQNAESAESAYAAVEAFTAQLPEWEGRARALPRPVGDMPFLLAVQVQRAEQQMAHVLRAWAQLQLRSADAYGKPALLTQALPELAASLRSGTRLRVPKADKMGEIYLACEAFLPKAHEVMSALSAVTDKQSADAAAAILENSLLNAPHAIDRWLEVFYPESECLLRQMNTLYKELGEKEPPFYGSEQLKDIFSGKKSSICLLRSACCGISVGLLHLPIWNSTGK